MGRWRSWLSHLSNTQKVLSSNLGRLNFEPNAPFCFGLRASSPTFDGGFVLSQVYDRSRETIVNVECDRRQLHLTGRRAADRDRDFVQVVLNAMDASIGDPFVLAAYASQQKPSKGKQRQALPHVYATYTPGPRDGYVTATVQGDGIHTLDVRTS